MKINPRKAVADRKRNERLRAKIAEYKKPHAVRRLRYILYGEVFYSKEAAADACGVSPRTILNWCDGYKCRGKFVEPRKDCYIEEV